MLSPSYQALSLKHLPPGVATSVTLSWYLGRFVILLILEVSEWLSFCVFNMFPLSDQQTQSFVSMQHNYSQCFEGPSEQ